MAARPGVAPYHGGVTEAPGVLTYAYRGCVFEVPDALAAPKKGSLFFCRNLTVVRGQRMLEIGAGLGLAAVLAAKAGAHVVATDVVPEAVDAEICELAANLATTDDAHLFGDNEFQIRALAHKIAAKAIEQHLAQKKMDTTGPA